MPFNSSTPKTDGYHISSSLATEIKAADEGSLLACKSTLTTHRWAELSSQPNSPKYCTYILFTALSQREGGEEKIQTHTSIPWQTAPTRYLHLDYIYTIHTWARTCCGFKCKKKSLCFPLLLHRFTAIHGMSTFIHREQAFFTISPPGWPVANDNRKTETIKMRGKRRFSLLWQHLSRSAGLFMKYLQKGTITKELPNKSHLRASTAVLHIYSLYYM